MYGLSKVIDASHLLLVNIERPYDLCNDVPLDIISLIESLVMYVERFNELCGAVM